MRKPTTPQLVQDSPGESSAVLIAGLLVVLNLAGVEIDALAVAAIIGAIPAAVKYWKSIRGD